ncbi:unnamed protein product [Adineta steineri]|uniref:Uncharacterized protein n=1 Tax=Adineta steineri TaxID=433720 RepID=A0A818III1_9BILA|nr:unnamed protein product [Adineta steineri]CAF3507156.1 unnamed protein product [Adineta steineri]CAF3525000.1 unnamed protein product [Adineta steineri]
MLYNIIIIIILSVNCVVYTLRCYGDNTCDFQIKFNESFPAQHLWPESCRLNIQETDADTYMHHLYNSLGTTLPITRVSLTNAFSGNYHCILYPVVTYPTFALWMKSIAFFYYSAP